MNKYLIIYKKTKEIDTISHEIIFANSYLDCINKCIDKGYPLQQDIDSINKLNN